MKTLICLLLFISPAQAEFKYSKMKLFKMVRNNQIIFTEKGPVPQTKDFTWDNVGDYKKIKNSIGDVLMFDLRNERINSAHEVTSCWTEATCRYVKFLKFEHGKFSSASRCQVNRENFQWKSTCETVTANLCQEIKKNLAKMGSFEKCVPGFDDEKVRPGCPQIPQQAEAKERFELAKKIMQQHEKEISNIAIATNKMATEMGKSAFINAKTGIGRHMPAGSPVTLTAISEDSSLPRHSSRGEYLGYMWGLHKAHSLCHDAGVMGR